MQDDEEKEFIFQRCFCQEIHSYGHKQYFSQPEFKKSWILKGRMTKTLYLPIDCTRIKKQFNPLPEDKILDWSKLKQITDNILKYI